MEIEIAPDAGEPGSTGRGPWSLMWRRLRRDKVAMLSVVFIFLLIVFAAAAPAFESWTGHEKNTSNSAGTDPLTLLPVGPMTGCSGLADVGERGLLRPRRVQRRRLRHARPAELRRPHLAVHRHRRHHAHRVAWRC